MPMFRWRGRKVDDFSAEVQSHIELEEARLVERGVAPDEARRRARVAFGNAVGARERFRESSPWRWLETLWQDVGYGARLLKRSPAFAVTAIVVLSLGIGMSVALFSIVNSVLYRHIPVRDPDSVFYVYTHNLSGQLMPASARPPKAFGPPARMRVGDLLWESLSEVADLTGSVEQSAPVTVGDETEVLSGEMVSPSYFDLLGVSMQMGRPLRPEEELAGNPDLSMVISDDLWTRSFKRAPNIIGTNVQIANRAFRVVGVAPPGFHGLSEPWGPTQFWTTATQRMETPFSGLYPIVGRLKPGMSFRHLRALLDARTPDLRNQEWQTLQQDTRDRYASWLRITPLLEVRKIEDVVTRWAPSATIVPPAALAAVGLVVGLVLVIATTNIAGLLLARGVSRTGEIAVRQALGAGGRRVFRQMLTESLLLAFAGGAIAIGLASGLVRLFLASVPSMFVFEIAVDWRVMAFAVITCAGTGVLVGLVPALQARRVDMLQALGSGVIGARHTGTTLRRWLVIPQLALSLALLVAAAVYARSLAEVALADSGYRREGITVMNVGRADADDYAPPNRDPAVREARAAATRAFYRSVLARLGTEPSVERFGLSSELPVTSFGPGGYMIEALDLPGRPSLRVGLLHVSAGYFDTMGMKVLRGRTFDARDPQYQSDGLHGRRVAVISESVATGLWQGGDPIGRSVRITTNGSTDEYDVVGVANEVSSILGETGDSPRVYASLLQQWQGYAPILVVSGSGDRASLAARAKAAVLGADTLARVSGQRSIEEAVAGILYPRRLAAAILSTAAGIGLLLSSIGLYGIVAYSAAQRTRELGIRATLGATRRHIFDLVIREGVIVVAIGSVSGLLVGYAVLRATAGLIAKVPSVDIVAFVGAPLVLVAVVLGASLLPAFRASRVDPAVVLRGE